MVSVVLESMVGSVFESWNWRVRDVPVRVGGGGKPFVFGQFVVCPCGVN